MAKPVLSFSTRRWRAWSITAIVIAVLSTWLAAHTVSLRDTARLSGWTLLGTMLFLTAYNARKKLPYPPLISSSTWLQFHLYVGIVSIVLFLFHAGPAVPNGALEATIWTLFVGVALSGLIGLFLSRTLPTRLAVRGQEVLFERIPVFRRELREKAQDLVVRCAEESDLTTLADFYTRRLADFFAGPRHFWVHVLQSNRPRHRLIREIRSLERYFNPEEHRIAGELIIIIEDKDSLDYHRAMQSILKGWLFVHIPLTYALLVLGLAHAVLASAFYAGLP